MSFDLGEHARVDLTALRAVHPADYPLANIPKRDGLYQSAFYRAAFLYYEAALAQMEGGGVPAGSNITKAVPEFPSGDDIVPFEHLFVLSVADDVFFHAGYQRWISVYPRTLVLGKNGNTNNRLTLNGVSLAPNNGFIFAQDRDAHISKWNGSIRNPSNTYIRLRADYATLIESNFDNTVGFRDDVAELFPRGARLNVDIGDTIRDPLVSVEWRWSYPRT